MVSLKLSQGAKPGLGGVLPGAKVTREIAQTRDVPQGETVISPPYHQVFSTSRELVQFIGHFRDPAGGKPAGFKLCLGSRTDFLAICKAMVEEDPRFWAPGCGTRSRSAPPGRSRPASTSSSGSSRAPTTPTRRGR
jgi:hypothetical protein